MKDARSVALAKRIAAVGFVATVLVAALAFAPPHALAQSFDITGITTIENTAEGWFSTAQQWAKNLYTALFVIELTILGIQGILFRDNLAEFMASVGFKVFTAGFFMWLIVNADSFFHGIINGFKSAGQQLGTGDGGLTAVVAQGLASAALLFGAASAAHGEDTTLSFVPNLYLGTGPTGMGNAAAGGHAVFDLFVTGIGMMVVFAMAGIIIQYALITIESYIVFGAGVLFLGFSGSRFTMPFAQGYLQYAMNVGVKLFTFYLMLGAVQQLMPNAMIFSGATMAVALIPYGYGADIAILPASIAAFTLLLVTTLLYAVPNFAGAFLSGTSSLNAGQMMGQLTNAVSGVGQMRAGFSQMAHRAELGNTLQALRSPGSGQAPGAPAGTGALYQHDTPGATPTALGAAGAVGAAAGVAGAETDRSAAVAASDGLTGSQDQISQRPSQSFVGGSNRVAVQGNGSNGRVTPAVDGESVPAARLAGSASSSADPAAADADGTSSYPYSPWATPRGPGTSGSFGAGSNNTAFVPPPPPTAPQATDAPIRPGDAVPTDPEVFRRRIAATRFADLSPEQQSQIHDNDVLRDIAQGVYGDQYQRERSNEAYGGMSAFSGMRGLTPPPDAPVSGVQIRLNSPDRL